jgi:hypothetical protein
MRLYSIRARPKVQQCLKHVLAASEPNSTYDAVIIGGGMNVHFVAIYILLIFLCRFIYLSSLEIAECTQAWSGPCNGQLTKSNLRAARFYS